MSNGFNYVTSNRFYVEMESSIRASFSECSGLEVKIKNEKKAVGGVSDQQRVLLKETEYSDVTLKRGVTDDQAFWDWVTQVFAAGGKPKRRNINILVFNQAGETMQVWTLVSAVPVGWKAPAMKADSNTLALEELVLAFESLKVSRSAGGSTDVSTRRDPGSGGAFV
jgi:phage tail-like protein